MIEATAVIIENGKSFRIVAMPEQTTMLIRIVTVVAQVHAEHALIGLKARVRFPSKPWLMPKQGLLVRLQLPVDVAEKALDRLAADEDPESIEMEFSTTSVKEMNEPCVRVPLSLLRELRAQESVSERSRQALLQAWSRDRRTGKVKTAVDDPEEIEDNDPRYAGPFHDGTGVTK